MRNCMKSKIPEKGRSCNRKKQNRFLAELLAGILVMVSAFGLAGCGAGNDSETVSGSAEKLQVDVILKTRSTEYWGYVEAGAKAYENHHDDVEVTVKGASSETAYEEQSNMIQTDLKDSGYDAIIIAPLDAETAEQEIRTRRNTGTQILALDTRFGKDQGIPFIGTANWKAASAGGRAAAQKARAIGWKKITYVLIGGVKGDGNSRKRMKGFRSGLQSEGGKSLGFAAYGDGEPEKVRKQMRHFIKEHPEGVAVVAANNDDAAMAALKECRKRGGKAYANTVFIGFDGNGYTCDAISEKGLYKNLMTVAQNPYSMGYEAVREAVHAIRGQQVPEVKDCGYQIITSSNVQKRIRKIRRQWQ